jgi:hypothetical protein
VAIASPCALKPMTPGEAFWSTQSKSSHPHSSPLTPVDRGSGRLVTPLAAGFNQSAKLVQTNPNKTKQNSLDFLGFIRPNRDFSMGYQRKN